MQKLITTLGITATLLFAHANRAEAQEEQQGGSAFGVGMETILNASLSSTFDIAAAAFHFEAPRFHVDGLLVFVDVENTSTTMGVGGRFFYSVHQGQRSDFSVGGGLLLLNVDPDVGQGGTDFHLEGGAKIRAWITPNVSVNAIVGLSILLADDDSFFNDDVIGLFGQLHSAFGVTYVFR